MARSRGPGPASPPPFDRAALAVYLTNLEKPDGRLLEEDVVADARNPASPLHPHFEWDNRAAAEAHRLQQARQLIRMVRVVVTVHRVDVTGPKYVRDYKNDGVGYRDVALVRREEDIRRETFVAELLRVRSAMRRAKATAHVLGLSEEIDAIDELVTGLCRRVSIDDDPPSATPS
jgi:hypothetical protein